MEVGMRELGGTVRGIKAGQREIKDKVDEWAVKAVGGWAEDLAKMREEVSEATAKRTALEERLARMEETWGEAWREERDVEGRQR